MPTSERRLAPRAGPSPVTSVQREDLDLAVTLAITPDAPGMRVGAMRLRWVADPALDIPHGCTNPDLARTPVVSSSRIG